MWKSNEIVKEKVQQLAKWMAASSHTVILTGAGISTVSVVTDFRGPKGIWTLEQKRKASDRKRKRDENSNNGTISSPPPTSRIQFKDARPSLTHRVITKLVQDNRVRYYCITQNVDGLLHAKAGLSRKDHAVLHGCVSLRNNMKDARLSIFERQILGE